MRVSSYAQPSHIPPIAPSPVQAAPPAPAQFLPFSAEAFQQARTRDVPVLLFISDAPPTLSDAALSMQIAERTVPVWLYPGMHPDVELLCQRAGALFSEEGAASPVRPDAGRRARISGRALPPAGFALDPSRLYVWLSQADRRFAQNRDAFIRQAVQTLRSFRTEPLRKPYSPHDAAHDLVRALSAVHDPINGGFGKLKQPLCPALRFLSRAAIGSHQARTALDQTLEAMLASDLYDPLDGAFFRATLTEDWRVFVPEKPLALNALLALTLLESGRRAEAVRALDFLLSAFSVPGGMLNPCLTYSRESCAFYARTGLRRARRRGRACVPAVCWGCAANTRALPPKVTPSRFSPVEDAGQTDLPRTPTLPKTLTPEDAAFLRRVMPQLLRVRAARTPPTAAPCVLTEDCALAATVFALCGRRLGEARYIRWPSGRRRADRAFARPAPVVYARERTQRPAHLRRGCGAGAGAADAGAGRSAVCLPGKRSASAGRGAASVHRPKRHADAHPAGLGRLLSRIPAIFDSELPSPAALLLHALALADGFRPEAGYREAAHTLWAAAAPYARQQPLACAGLIDAANFTLSGSPEAQTRPQ